MRPYQVYLHSSLLDAVPRSGPQRRLLMKFILSLREHPDRRGDFTERGWDGRDCEVKLIGAWAVAWWLDAPVNTIMVVSVRPAD